MRQRGKQEGAQGTAAKRPDAPSWLSVEEAETWIETVNALPEDWFPSETHQLLAMYCGHVARYRYFSELLKKAFAEAAEPCEDGKAKALDTYLVKDLQSFAAKESTAAANLATKMRITQQSHFAPSRNTRGKGAANPIWEK